MRLITLLDELHNNEENKPEVLYNIFIVVLSYIIKLIVNKK